MSVLALYIITVVIWGTTWLAIKQQIGIVPLELSIAYRFIFASFLLLLYSLYKKIDLRLSPRQHFSVLTLGLFIFCLNYICTYYASKFLASGLVAVVFSMVTTVNVINSRIFLGHRASQRLLGGVVIGLIGIVLVFYQDLLKLDPNAQTIMGLAFAFLGTVFASFGNIISSVNQKNGIQIIPANVYGMFYGGVITLCIGLCKGDTLIFDTSMSYILSLLYLSVFGSIVAFGSYFSLVKLIGPTRASYSAVLFPIVALILSTIFESYQWQLTSLIGVLAIIAGNIFVMKNKV
ncbi:MAG: EamA family transporter [Oligoflexia bacterium]|nr:EamA family transporter [Oligoflexia bacterium]